MKIIICIAVLAFCCNNLQAQTGNKPPDSLTRKASTMQVVMPNGDTATFTKVEIESEFPGGAQAWQQFLGANLVYPEKAIKKIIQGTVVLQFIVDKDGSISDLKALSGPDILKQAALAAMQHSPRWIPAVQNDKPVKSYKKQAINFKLVP